MKFRVMRLKYFATTVAVEQIVKSIPIKTRTSVTLKYKFKFSSVKLQCDYWIVPSSIIVCSISS